MTTIMARQLPRSSNTTSWTGLLAWSLSTGMAGLYKTYFSYNENQLTHENRLKAQKLIPPTAATPRPVNVALPSANFTTFAGNYSSPGYGKFELCLISPENPSASSTCQAMASNVSTILPGAIRPGIPTYLGLFDSPWFTHMRMEHFSGNLFNISLLITTVSRKYISTLL